MSSVEMRLERIKSWRQTKDLFDMKNKWYISAGIDKLSMVDEIVNKIKVNFVWNSLKW